jgi:hypothetical protein
MVLYAFIAWDLTLFVPEDALDPVAHDKEIERTTTLIRKDNTICEADIVDDLIM